MTKEDFKIGDKIKETNPYVGIIFYTITNIKKLYVEAKSVNGHTIKISLLKSLNEDNLKIVGEKGFNTCNYSLIKK